MIPVEPSDSETQTTLDLPAPSLAGPKPRGKRRRRGSVEVLPSGAVRVRLRGVSLPDGRTVELAKTITEGPSIAWRSEEARRVVRPALERQALDLECGRASYDSGTTLAECLQRLRQSHAIPWRRADETMWKRLRSEWQVPLANVTEDRARALFGKWEREGRSPSYARACFGLLRRILNIAARKGMLARVPIWPPGLLPPKSSAKRGQSVKLSASQKVALFEAARLHDVERGSDLADRLAFQLDLMLRPIECAWARTEDLREDEDGWHFYPQRAKGSGLRDGEGIDRLFVGEALARRVLGRLDGLPARARALGVLFPRPLPRGLWAVRWSEERGSRTGDGWITEAEVESLRKRSGIADFIPYALRHTRAHELAKAGASEWQLQQYGAWRNREQVSTYVGRVIEKHAAMLAPSAPTPGAVGLRVVDSPPERSATEPAAIGKYPASLGLPANGDNRVGSDVGPGGRGSAVGGDALSWAGKGSEGRADALARVKDAMASVADYADPQGAASALVRREGVERCRELVLDLRAVSSVGAAGVDGPRVAGLLAALSAHVAIRGAKKGAGSPKRSMNLRALGAPAGYSTGVIDTAAADSHKAPGKGPKK